MQPLTVKVRRGAGNVPAVSWLCHFPFEARQAGLGVMVMVGVTVRVGVEVTVAVEVNVAVGVEVGMGVFEGDGLLVGCNVGVGGVGDVA